MAVDQILDVSSLFLKLSFLPPFLLLLFDLLPDLGLRDEVVGVGKLKMGLPGLSDSVAKSVVPPPLQVAAQSPG